MISFVKLALKKAKNKDHARTDLSINSMSEKFILYLLVIFEGREGYVVNIDDDEITVNFCLSENLELATIKYSLLSNADFTISYCNLYESFEYGNLVSYYLFHKKPIIRLRRLIRIFKNKILTKLSIKKADLHTVVTILVEKAARIDNRKSYIDEYDLMKVLNPFIGMLSENIVHKDYNPAKGYYRLMLNALVESGNIEPEGMGFVIKPKIFLTHNKMESERKKHMQVVSVTAIAAIASVIAAVASVYSALSS